jgi:hypothetical protein
MKTDHVNKENQFLFKVKGLFDLRTFSNFYFMFLLLITKLPPYFHIFT